MARSTPMCLQFNQFSRSKTPGQHCFGNLDVGREYVCPNVGPPTQIEEQVLSPWFLQQAERLGMRRTGTCHGVMPQLGDTIQCKSKHQRQRQHGGSAIGSPATVQQLDFDSLKMQYSATGDLIESNCDSCRFKKASSQNQRGGAGLWLGQFDSPGYFLDVSQPAIGRRPVAREHNNTIPAVVGKHKQNLDRKFNCRQPSWSPKCI